MWLGFLIDHMFFRKRHWNLISERTLCLTGMKPNYYLKLFWSMWCPEISFPRILCVGPVLYPKEIYGIVFVSMSLYITFKKKLGGLQPPQLCIKELTVIKDWYLTKNFTMWVTRGSYVGHIRIALWVSKSTCVTNFQPCLITSYCFQS